MFCCLLMKNRRNLTKTVSPAQLPLISTVSPRKAPSEVLSATHR